MNVIYCIKKTEKHKILFNYYMLTYRIGMLRLSQRLVTVLTYDLVLFYHVLSKAPLLSKHKADFLYQCS